MRSIVDYHVPISAKHRQEHQAQLRTFGLTLIRAVGLGIGFYLYATLVLGGCS